MTEPQKRKILIFGSDGMLGQELLHQWSDEQCIGVDRSQIDITQRELVHQLITREKPVVVINAAAYNNVDGAEVDVDEANAVNGTAVGYIASAAESIGAVFVHYSTDYVFDGEKKEGYREDDPPTPISIYGKSKLLGEDQAREHSSHLYLIRLSRLFGAPAKSQGAKQSFIEKIIEQSQDRSTLTVIDEELSCPTYAPDLAATTKNLIDTQAEFGVYHVTNTGACTWFGLAQEIFTQRQWHGTLVSVPSSTFPRPARRPRYSVLLDTKLPPMRSWQEAVREYLSNR